MESTNRLWLRCNCLISLKRPNEILPAGIRVPYRQNIRAAYANQLKRNVKNRAIKSLMRNQLRSQTDTVKYEKLTSSRKRTSFPAKRRRNDEIVHINFGAGPLNKFSKWPQSVGLIERRPEPKNKTNARRRHFDDNNNTDGCANDWRIMINRRSYTHSDRTLTIPMFKTIIIFITTFLVSK